MDVLQNAGFLQTQHCCYSGLAFIALQSLLVRRSWVLLLGTH
jgi:hypothetical protein